MFVDTHCHVDFDAYDEDRAAILDRARDAGVQAVIDPGVDLNSSTAICDLAADIDLLYAAVGIHPNSTAAVGPDELTALGDLVARPKVVAVGEIGLDYYRDRSPKQTQQVAFTAQLDLAAACELPVIIHNREATEDTVAILRDWVAGLPADHPQRERPGVLHSFSAPASFVDEILALGFYMGITGPVTFKKAEELRRIVAQAPVDRLLIETDGPFLTPHPYRGKRNEPAYVQYIADRIAAVRLTSVEEIGIQTTRNAGRLFGLPLNIPA